MRGALLAQRHDGVIEDVMALVSDYKVAQARIVELEALVGSLQAELAECRPESGHLNNPYLRDRVRDQARPASRGDGSYYFLTDNKIEFIYELVRYDADQILKHRRCGPATVKRFNKLLASLGGLRLGLKLEGFVL